MQPDHQLAPRVEPVEKLGHRADGVGRVLRSGLVQIFFFAVGIVVFGIIGIVVFGIFILRILGIFFSIFFRILGIVILGILGILGILFRTDVFGRAGISKLGFKLGNPGLKFLDFGVRVAGIRGFVAARRKRLGAADILFGADILETGVFRTCVFLGSGVFPAGFLLLIFLGLRGDCFVQRLLPETKTQQCLLFRIFCHCSDSFC